MFVDLKNFNKKFPNPIYDGNSKNNDIYVKIKNKMCSSAPLGVIIVVHPSTN
jgi:hypothetical protein